MGSLSICSTACDLLGLRTSRSARTELDEIQIVGGFVNLLGAIISSLAQGSPSQSDRSRLFLLSGAFNRLPDPDSRVN
jgi:hypothetical protein